MHLVCAAKLPLFSDARVASLMQCWWCCHCPPQMESAWDATMDVVEWRRPVASSVVFTVLLLVAWNGWLQYALPLVVLANAWVLLQLAPRDSSEASIRRGRAADGAGERPSLIQRFLRIRKTLGDTQRRMHKTNTVVLKLRSLYTWQRPVYTRVFLAGHILLFLALCLVPSRLLFGLAVFGVFSAPVRRPGDSPVTKLARRFVAGLPTPGPRDLAYSVEPVTHPSETAVSVIGDVSWRWPGRR